VPKLGVGQGVGPRTADVAGSQVRTNDRVRLGNDRVYGMIENQDLWMENGRASNKANGLGTKKYFFDDRSHDAAHRNHELLQLDLNYFAASRQAMAEELKLFVDTNYGRTL